MVPVAMIVELLPVLEPDRFSDPPLDALSIDRRLATTSDAGSRWGRRPMRPSADEGGERRRVRRSDDGETGECSA